MIFTKYGKNCSWTKKRARNKIAKEQEICFYNANKLIKKEKKAYRLRIYL